MILAKLFALSPQTHDANHLLHSSFQWIAWSTATFATILRIPQWDCAPGLGLAPMVGALTEPTLLFQLTNMTNVTGGALRHVPPVLGAYLLLFSSNPTPSAEPSLCSEDQERWYGHEVVYPGAGRLHAQIRKRYLRRRPKGGDTSYSKRSLNFQILALGHHSLYMYAPRLVS